MAAVLRIGAHVSGLSPREEEIVHLIASGKTTKEIAGELSIAESTVNWHVSNALAKLSASTRAEAVAKVIRESGRPVSAVDRRDPDPTEHLPTVERAAEPAAGGRGRRLVVATALAMAIVALVAASAIAGSSALERRPSSYPSSMPPAPAVTATPMTTTVPPVTDALPTAAASPRP